MVRFFKWIGPDVAAVLLFILIGLVYFFSPVADGLVLSGSDHTGAIGSGQELIEYHERTGEQTRWTNSLFSGMPTYQMSPSYASRSALGWLRSVYELGLPTVVMYVFVLLLGFYILMRAFGYRPLVSVLGAVAWAFSSYFFIIIGAGHIWKVMTLAFIPPTIAGMVLCYRGRYLWGGVVLALFLAFQILSNHLQMTYYFLLVMGLMVLAYLIEAIMQREMKRFLKATATVVVAAVVAVGANVSNLYHTYEYSKETMRGRSELAEAGSSESSGLSAEYITQWSYGIDETWTLLIPNAKGGASVPLSSSDVAMEKGRFSQYYNGFSMYWGEQPGTSGPVYVGAIIVLLAIIGLFVVKGPMKWALLAATVVSVLLSWGHNFMWLTQLCIDYVPLYNKFRTVSSILVIAEFTIPLLALMALARILKERGAALGRGLWKFWVGAGLTLLLLLGAIACADSFSYLTFMEREQLAQYPEILQDLKEVRLAIFVSDAWRSFWFVLMGAAVLFLYLKTKFRGWAAVLVLLVLCLWDMYGVNKRYLNDDMFVEPHQIEASFHKSLADEQILQDADLDYRVLNFTTNTFNENETSYFHKSVGGYSAVKLGRYQDLINRHIAPEMEKVVNAFNSCEGDLNRVRCDSVFPVLCMLNAKYFILGKRGQEFAVRNPGAMGNGWFVDDVKLVSSANEEISALSSVNIGRTGVVDRAFEPLLKGATQAHDSLDFVCLKKYDANELDYEVVSKGGGLVVFSEIFYPGWKATIDGEPLELLRANYVLRAACVPSGRHLIHMEYKPASIATTEAIGYVSLALLVLGFVGAAGLSIVGLVRKGKE